MSEMISNFNNSQAIRGDLAGPLKPNEALLNPASRWKRLAAVLVDSFFALVVMVPILLTSGILPQAFKGQPLTLNQQIAMMMVGWGAFLLMHGYLLYTKGQTLGKAAVNIKMVDANGDVPSFGKLLGLRYVLPALVGYIPVVGGIIALADVLFIFSQDERCLHDQLAGTWVVNE